MHPYVDLPSSVAPMFRNAGWRPGREVANEVSVSHPARFVLRAFSGLSVGASGRGKTCARSSIDFYLLQSDEEIREWERLLAVTFVGVGEVCKGHGQFWIASDGRCFGRSMVHEAFYFEGEDFTTAVERILLGRRARPLIHPSQDDVMLYGETYTRSHPDVYEYG